MENGSCPPGQQGEIQIPGKLAEPTEYNRRPQRNDSDGGPAKGQALSLKWGIQNGGDFGPTH